MLCNCVLLSPGQPGKLPCPTVTCPSPWKVINDLGSFPRTLSHEKQGPLPQLLAPGRQSQGDRLPQGPVFPMSPQEEQLLNLTRSPGRVLGAPKHLP